MALGNDLHLIFGGTLPLVVAVAFGPVWGLVAGTLAALKTLALWQHGLGIAVFAAEAFAVGWLARRWRMTPPFADALFWAAVFPAIQFSFVKMALYPDNFGLLVALKYALNGLLYATLADLCLWMPWLRQRLERYGAALPEDTLADRLARALMLAALAPVCFLVIWHVRAESDQRLGEARKALSAQARLTASILGDKVAEMRQAVAALAERLGEQARDRASIAREVERFQAQGRAFARLAVADAAGETTLVSPFASPETAGGANCSCVAAAIATRAPSVSQSFCRRGDGFDLVVSFCAPILSADGAVQGAVEGQVTVKKLSEAVLTVSEPDLPVVVLDRASKVLLTTRPDLFPPLAESALSQAQARAMASDTVGLVCEVPESGLMRRFWVWQVVEPETQWRCYALLPFSVAYEHAMTAFLPTLLAIPFALLVAACSSSFAARLMMRPLDDLAASARAIARSPDLLHQAKSAPPSARRLPREIARLQEAFQVMAARLGETLERLQQTSIEREIARQRLEDAHADLERRLAAQAAEIERRETLRLQSEKLKALGELTGGIAHNFNNLLTVILNYSSLELGSHAPDAPSHKRLLAIRRAAERGRDMIKQLMSYSRASDASGVVHLSLHASLRAVQALAEKLLGEDIELRMSLSAADLTVCAVPQELEQVFLNLLINARDAMPEGGVITVETTLLATATAEAGGRWLPPDANLAAMLAAQRVVRISVRDTGTGMTPETMSRLCEPFFTTKPQGKGTGLGLSTVLGTVKSIGGLLRVESEIGSGAVFHVYLPVADRPVEQRDSGSRRIPALNSQEPALRALVVEDDPEVRESVASALATAGFSVIEARDGQEALEIIQRQDRRLDLVITDVRMPNVNGIRLASLLRQQYPSLPVLFISGYADKQDTGECFVFENNLLYKPFTAHEIVEKTREMVAASLS